MSKPNRKPKFVAVPVGTRVTCQYRGAHQGTVLAYDDPRCWAGSIAFPLATPSQAEVSAHVARCLGATGPWEHQPVLWDFGKIWWDHQLQQVAIASVITDEELVAHG